MRKHKFLTEEILKDFRKIGEQANSSDPLIVCKFFDPCSQRTRFATEYDERTREFFGFVIGVEQEWGYFSLYDLLSYKGPLGIGLERDAHFTRCRFSELKGVTAA